MRYKFSDKFFLRKDAKYDRILKKRNVREGVMMLGTPEIGHPADLDTSLIFETEEIWSHSTKLWKLAAKYYGDGNLYWVIALYNSRPTDAHWKIGDIVYIPQPVEYVADILRGS